MKNKVNLLKNLISIVGPTAVGKTKLCIELATKFNTEIISADARQCYKDLNIGTAKPTKEERAKAKHHLIDFLPLEYNYSAGKFAIDATNILNDLWEKKTKIILSGGSGLYIKSLCEGLDEMPKIDMVIRENLSHQLIFRGLHNLVKDLKKIDPEYCTEENIKNPRRVVRALEIYEATGKRYSSLLHLEEKKKPDFNLIKIGLLRDRDELYKRINDRVDIMIEKGLIQEAESFYKYRHYNSLYTVGYRELFNYLDKEISKEYTIELIKRNTRRYAKRQITWFSKDQDIKWFHPDDLDSIYSHIQNNLKIKNC